ncbi:MAG: response regulator [Isosphaeraceae bacterium]|nr:response regulator [Isosphaeraceae bacterium]
MSGPRIVIVEEDAVARNALAGYFLAQGWLVTAVGTTAEGLMCLDPLPDCVLLDLMQPGRGGELLLWKVRSEKLPVRVVVTSASCDSERANAVMSLSPEAFLKKPVDAATVYRACQGGPEVTGRSG